MPRRPRPDASRSPLLLPLEQPELATPKPGACVVDRHTAEAGLVAASAALEASNSGASDPWASSPFRWIKSLSAPSRGKVGVALVDLMLRGAGFAVAERSGSGHDLVVEQSRVQVRFSTLWTAGWYTFQKIRDTGDYEQLILLGLSPTVGHAWVVRRTVAVAATNIGSDPGWWTVDPSAPPAVLGPGSLDTFLAAAASCFGAPSAQPHGPARIGDTSTGAA